MILQARKLFYSHCYSTNITHSLESHYISFWRSLGSIKFQATYLVHIETFIFDLIHRLSYCVSLRFPPPHLGLREIGFSLNRFEFSQLILKKSYQVDTGLYYSGIISGLTRSHFGKCTTVSLTCTSIFIYTYMLLLTGFCPGGSEIIS